MTDRRLGFGCCLAYAVAAGCAASPDRPVPRGPSVAPTTQSTLAASLDVDASQTRPMYRELLAVDLPTVVQVAMARSLDLQAARQRLEASKGRYEASVEAIFPVIAPSLAYQHLEGVNQQANGTLVHTTFNTFLPALAVQWILNPGRVAYDVVASKRRLAAARDAERAAALDTARQAAVQYYDLVLAQARLAVARQAVAESEELQRITDVRVRAGNALTADALRAQASLAARQQDLELAVNAFYQASVTLTVTLDLDPSVTLVPRNGPVHQATLVREDLPIDQLLATALQYRPDLEAARSLLKAAEADRGSVAWGAVGPQVQASYSYGGIQGNAIGQSFGLTEQQKGYAGVGVAFGPSVFGQLKVAGATEKLASLDVQRLLDQVRAAVVRAQQNSATNAALVPMARRQLDAAQEALRLAQANLRAGTMLEVDVLQAQDAVDQARLRFAEAVVRYNQSQVELLAALGLLDRDRITAAQEPTTQAAAK